MKLADDDQVVSVFPGWDDYELLLVTARRPGHPVRGGRGAAGRPQRRQHARDQAQGRRPRDRRLRGRARGDRRDRDRRGLRQAHRGRRVPGAGARRFGPEGGEDRQGARRGRGGRAARPRRSRSSRKDGAVVVPSASVRAAARDDGGGSKVAGVEGELLRVVAVVARRSPTSRYRRERAQPTARGSRRCSSRAS